MLPEKLIASIPPRPLGYARSREVIKLRTDLTFDPLTAAESAADLTVSLLLHPARAGRLVEYNARDPKQPSLESTIEKLLTATLKAQPSAGYEKAVQITVNAVVLNNLIKLALNNEASALVRSIVNLKLSQIKLYASSKLKVEDEQWQAHYLDVVSRINKFMENPEAYKHENFLPPPPGQPIGETLLDYCNDY
jgi:hypothetical protein